MVAKEKAPLGVVAQLEFARKIPDHYIIDVTRKKHFSDLRNAFNLVHNRIANDPTLCQKEILQLLQKIKYELKQEENF